MRKIAEDKLDGRVPEVIEDLPEQLLPEDDLLLDNVVKGRMIPFQIIRHSKID